MSPSTNTPVRRLSRRLDRRDALAFWRRLPYSPCRAWFSGDGWLGGGRTLFAWGPPAWIFRGQGEQAEWQGANRPPRKLRVTDPLEMIRGFLPGSSARDAAAFNGGAVGFWGYDCRHAFGAGRGARKKLPRTSAIPDFFWAWPSFWAVAEADGTWTLLHQPAEESPAESRRLLERLAEKIESLPRETPGATGPADLDPGLNRLLRRGESRYVAGVRRVQKYIAAGDIYQANLSRPIRFPWGRTGDAARFFASLVRTNPSPYAAFMEFPGFSFASCSPELLLRARGADVETRPIAGTRPRGRTPGEDRALAGELLLNAKERAEHIMLVDLERNDLGRVCRPGSVSVSERMVLEKYSHVIHIVSHVRGRLADGRDGLDAVRAVFPGGTITGCPKIRCMEILDDLEENERGPFFGSAGWIGPDGDTELNILIRTALFEGDSMTLRAGAGIVADSRPEREFEETIHKARALAAAYQSVRGKNELRRAAPAPSKG